MFDGLDPETEKWVDLLPVVLKKYNKRDHGTTGMSQHDAITYEYNIQVYLNIRKHAQYKRPYPTLDVGDSVRKCVKPHTFKQGYNSALSSRSL